MNIFQLKDFSFQASEVSSGTIQNNEFSALLDLVIPTSDSSALPLPTHQEPIESKFCTNSPSLNELVISHNLQLPASNPALIKPGPRWLKPMSVIPRPHRDASDTPAGSSTRTSTAVQG
ncbi:hypothetical protein GQ600_10586 [Phytophthora cactorum]|nr:hypothetical protein GQ600_10586 [Phytophthora cactorum]